MIMVHAAKAVSKESPQELDRDLDMADLIVQ
jgi:hypothetical protein